MRKFLFVRFFVLSFSFVFSLLLLSSLRWKRGACLSQFNLFSTNKFNWIPIKSIVNHYQYRDHQIVKYSAALVCTQHTHRDLIDVEWNSTETDKQTIIFEWIFVVRLLYRCFSFFLWRLCLVKLLFALPYGSQYYFSSGWPTMINKTLNENRTKIWTIIICFLLLLLLIVFSLLAQFALYTRTIHAPPQHFLFGVFFCLTFYSFVCKFCVNLSVVFTFSRLFRFALSVFLLSFCFL